MTLSGINLERSLDNHKIFHLKIIEKPGHGHMRYTKCHIHSLGRRDNIIYLHEYFIVPIKTGLRKFLTNTMRPKAWLVM